MLHREFSPSFSFSSVTEAVARMIDESTLSMKQIAARSGKTYATLSRELNIIDEGAKLGADLILPLCIASTTNGAASTPYPLLFLAEELGYRIVPAEVEPSASDSRDEMLDDNHAIAAFHDAIRKGKDLEMLKVLADAAHKEIEETMERIRRERKGE